MPSRGRPAFPVGFHGTLTATRATLMETSGASHGTYRYAVDNPNGSRGIPWDSMTYRWVRRELPRNLLRGPTGIPVVRPMGWHTRRVPRENPIVARRFPPAQASKTLGCIGNYSGNFCGNQAWIHAHVYFIVIYPGYTRDPMGNTMHPVGHRGLPCDAPRFPVAYATGLHGTQWYAVDSHGDFRWELGNKNNNVPHPKYLHIVAISVVHLVDRVTSTQLLST